MSKLDRALQIYRQEGAAELFARSSVYLFDRIEHVYSYGIVRRLIPSHRLINPRDKWEDTARFVRHQSPTIVDGGAAIASEDSVGSFLAVYDDPDIVAFEPRPGAASALERTYDTGNVTVKRLALGDENRAISFNVSGGASSALAPREMSGAPRSTITVHDEIETEQVRLDDVIDREVDVLKLDLQGLELDALRGAVGLLADVTVVLVEVNFRPVYEGSPIFSEIDRFLSERGFTLYSIYDIETWKTGELVWADALYVAGDP